MNTEVKSLDQAHQWTHDGAEVLILKFVDRDGRSYGGFTWPLTVGAEVAPERWDPTPSCSDGLHGWPWGLGVGDGKEPDWSGTWIVFGCPPEGVVGNLDGLQKCKASHGVVRFVGTWDAATVFVLAGQTALIHKCTSGAASSTGYRGAASSTGYSGAASSTGDSGAAQATGLDSKARSGQFGCVALAWWNDKANRAEMRCREIGCGDGTDGKLKACVWYQLNTAGKFVEIEDAENE